jgi:sulfite reductase beta subunit-like hemoprotein
MRSHQKVDECRTGVLIVFDGDGVTAAEITVGGVGCAAAHIAPLIDDAVAVHKDAIAVVRANVEAVIAAGEVERPRPAHRVILCAETGRR